MARLRIKPKRGGDKKLDAFRKAIETSPKLLDTISRNCAEETLDFVKERFRLEKDPYGNRWAPKKVPDGRKVLSGRTSRLKGGWHVAKANKRGWNVAPSVPYAAFHQGGTVTMVARKMVPENGRTPKALGKAWVGVAQEILSEHFKQASDGDAMDVPGFSIGGNHGIQRIARSAIRGFKSGI